MLSGRRAYGDRGVATRTTKGRCGWRQAGEGGWGGAGEAGEERGETDREVALIKIKYFSCSPNCVAYAKTVAQGAHVEGARGTLKEKEKEEGREGVAGQIMLVARYQRID